VTKCLAESAGIGEIPFPELGLDPQTPVSLLYPVRQRGRFGDLPVLWDRRTLLSQSPMSSGPEI